MARASALCCGLAIALLPHGAGALDSLTFDIPEADRELRSVLRGASVLVATEADETADAQDVFAAAQAEYGRLLAALYARGHYSAVISVRIDGREAAGIAPLDAPASISNVVVTVDPGPAFSFSRAAIAPLARGTELPPDFAIGEKAESGLIRQSVAAAVDGWRDVGHAKAAAAGQDIVADHARATLSAEIGIAPGPELRFGRLEVTGQQRMRLDRILAIAGLPEGARFSPEDLRRSGDRLRRTGVFRSVSLTEADTPNADGTLDITATVVEEKRRRFGYGAEIGSSDGLSLTGYWLHRNLFGGAERLRIDAGVTNIGSSDSGVDYLLGATLDRPATFSPDTTLTFAISVAHVDDLDEQSDIGSVGVGLTHRFSDTITGRTMLEFQHSRVEDIAGRNNFTVLALPSALTWDRRDDAFDASEGFFLDAQLTPFAGFNETGSGTRVYLDGRAYYGFGAKNGVVLAARMQVGAVVGPDLAATPRDYLFLSGGGGTVRGQPFESLGVNVLPDGQRTGGSYFLGGSAEVRVKVTEKIGVVGFFDAGQVAAEDFFSDSAEMHSGAGLGLRYATSIGPLRLDVAGPVSGDTGDGVQVYVGIGQAF